MFSKWKSRKNDRLGNEAGPQIEIKAPLTGRCIPLTEVPDAMFAGGQMGSGTAILPDEGRLLAPFDGKVAHIVKTGHALILEHPSGLQLLLHLGIDTVSLKGEGFNPRVSAGDVVSAGQILIEFDLDVIRTAGLSIASPVIVTGGETEFTVTECHYGPVRAGEHPILQAALKQ
ncbi:PTS glucose transporter subunit IIA [Paenibacillus sp. NFR01]|uniref:PTS sugar transporter subunit IIA n=1 Tax=Paenibacillus sp. NFR01 TaxID=1566279 RepID=UPI0008D2AECC|nr:PTS glucose transporter subunit IIA [Paenibacillus sp. NFR01]SET17244.1 PTS system, glucose-specific IIA component [Paenibacillus sp. NFR01]